MKMFVRNAGVLLLLIMSGYVIGGDRSYRIAGLIANGSDNWQAIVEVPNGEQILVNAGDLIGQVQVVQISKEGVTLLFPGGKSILQLSEDGFITLPHKSGDSPQGQKSGAGVPVGDYSKLVQKQLAPELLASVRGLESLDRLSNSARIVSYAYLGDPKAENTPIDSLKSGVNLLQQAIIEGKELRVTVEDDDSYTNFYVLPRAPE
jgi:hypothetical protein